jgi:hypothetical protein
MPLSLLIDEDLRDGALWDAIQRHNTASPDEAIDVLRVGDEGAPGLGTPDPDLLRQAIQSRRIIVTRDVNTLIEAHINLVEGGHWTPGVLILRKNLGIDEVVEYLALVCHATDEYEWECNCKFIPL